MKELFFYLFPALLYFFGTFFLCLAFYRLFSSGFFEGFVGVPIGTDAFVRNLVAKTWSDVEKLDAIQDGFIHYQILRFCQVTRL